MENNQENMIDSVEVEEVVTESAVDAAEKRDYKWFVIHTYASYETVVKKNLEQIVENSDLQDCIIEINIPTEQDIVEKDGKRKVIERKKFPGYVYLKMIKTIRKKPEDEDTLYDHICYLVTSTRGVTGFVGPQGKALPLTEDEVRRIGLEEVTSEDFTIKVGDSVRIVSGAFEKYMGTVEEVLFDKKKVKVMVHMFGRQTPIDLDFNQVEKY
ncbi:MAG: transcription termination/antitermination protein NusG [Bacillota bacterium]